MRLSYLGLISLAMGTASSILAWKKMSTCVDSDEGEEISTAEWVELGRIIFSSVLDGITGIDSKTVEKIVAGVDAALNDFTPGGRNTLVSEAP